MVYVFLASGFEEIEALAPIDILRRGGVKVATVGVTGNTIAGSHGIEVVADTDLRKLVLDETVEAVVLPGGMPGTLNLELNSGVSDAVDYAVQHDKYVCAICAAPMIIGKKGLLSGKNATCFPGYEKHLTGAVLSDKKVVQDGKFITAKGAGASIAFGLEILAALAGKEAAVDVAKKMQL